MLRMTASEVRSGTSFEWTLLLLLGIVGLSLAIVSGIAKQLPLAGKVDRASVTDEAVARKAVQVTALASSAVENPRGAAPLKEQARLTLGLPTALLW